MELDFRDNKGEFMFALHGEFAKNVYKHLETMPELKKTTMKIKNKGEFIVFKVLILTGYKLAILGDSKLDIVIKKGGYVKVS